MLRILVVEDEPPILRSIVSAVKSCGEQYVVADTAFNGRAALEKLKNAEIPFDLVLTDIRMPVMDGLALAETIHATMPELYCVVVSGYNDFAYVQGALRSHVYDYLIKPVQPEALTRCLTQIDEIVSRRAREKHEKRLQNAVDVRQMPDSDAAPEGAETFAPFLLCAGAFPMVADDALLPGRQLWLQMDLKAMFDPLLLPGESVTILDGKTAAEKIAVVETGEAGRGKELAYRLFSAFERKNLCAAVVYAAHLCTFNRLGETLGTMRVRLQNGVKFLKLCILRDVQTTALPVIGDEYAKKITEALRVFDREALGKAVRETVETMIALEAAQVQVSHYFKGIVSVNRKLFGVGEEAMQAYLYDVDFSISNALTAPAFCESMTYILYETACDEGMQPKTTDAEPPVIAKLEEYLKEHYTEELTNTRLSQVFGFVPSYLSRLFRTWRGMSPSEYLLKYRIRTAIGLMEADPDMLVKEAANKVGLKDPYYFSKLFKKETGMSPSEYFHGSRN